VKGAAEGWVVGRREVVCSAVSGKFLARRAGRAAHAPATRCRVHGGSPLSWRWDSHLDPERHRRTDDTSPAPRAALLRSLLAELGAHRWCGWGGDQSAPSRESAPRRPPTTARITTAATNSSPAMSAPSLATSGPGSPHLAGGCSLTEQGISAQLRHHGAVTQERHGHGVLLLCLH
jgi:hypothetical protein